MATNVTPFPNRIEEFANDERVAFSKDANRYILEDEDGNEWDWFEKDNKWIQAADPTQLEQEKELSKLLSEDFEEKAAASAADTTKKRKADSPPPVPTGHPTGKKQKAQQPREKTAIYVENLPLDVTVGELKEEFTRFGMIAESLSDDTPRIKLYTNDDGTPKGAALIVYFRPESVGMAINYADGWDLRPGKPAPGGPMRVSVADDSFKAHKNVQAKEEGTKPSGARKQDKKMIIQKNEAMNRRLADWDDDDPQALPETSSRWDKVVVLKHMFTLEELEEDSAALLDIKEDVRDECTKFGAVTNVVLYDKEPDGVLTVRFKDAQAARACAAALGKRKFSGFQVEAYISSGDETFMKSSKHDEDTGENRVQSAVDD
ncbi:hypothetical protein K431DRAFT_283668 [Polychaeton citri CBS 116435]|uniref:RRM domain-containing protein n=1 Tax=Polychaeton citri CBS 116435 TaxID=1314669 RepID=A0A9P4QDT4_9PEZI|nr:hypothetical protein K431DRAFT_283668 [Polychaeton citri CBS 116435]